MTDPIVPFVPTQPTSTWVNSRYSSLRGEDSETLRAIFQDLSEFLRQPTFTNGIKLGDGTPGTTDPVTGVHTPPPYIGVTKLVGPPPADFAVLNRMLADNAVNTRVIAAGSIVANKIFAGTITSNEIASLVLQIGKTISSNVFTSGTTGWLINADGSAEFNNVLVRGQLVTGASGQGVGHGNHIELDNNTSYGDGHRLRFYCGLAGEVDTAIASIRASAATGDLTISAGGNGIGHWPGIHLISTNGTVTVDASDTAVNGTMHVSGLITGTATNSQACSGTANYANSSGTSSGLAGTPSITVDAVTANSLAVSGSKSFRIAHPLRAGHDLIHSSIEGPRADLIYRGKATLAGGAATVSIDTVSRMTAGTFAALTRDPQVFLFNETGDAHPRASLSSADLTITCADATATIGWMVVAERADADIVKTYDSAGLYVTEPVTVPPPAPPTLGTQGAS